jgi:hypothetical protein
VVAFGRVEDGRGSLGHAATLRLPSPLIEPDVPISGIRLSDWLHREAYGEKPWPQASSARRLALLRFTIQLSLRVSPDYSHHPSDVPCPLPRRIARVLMSIASPLTRPSPIGRRVGIRIVTFEACSGFTRVTARRIAQLPKATFVTRLQPARLPHEPLVSYRINRQLSVWNLPPLVMRAFGALCQFRTHAPQQTASLRAQPSNDAAP